MNCKDKAGIVLFHADRTERFGLGTAESLGWGNLERQVVRLRQLLEIGGLDNQSALDVGCGYGELRQYIDELFSQVEYVGIDHFAPFLEYAAERFADRPDTTFLYGDFFSVTLPPADFVFASGTLSYRSDDSRFVFDAIDKLYAACRKGFGFNLLSHVAEPDTVVTAYSPDEILAHCRRRTPEVELREGYLDDDFTIFMRRPEQERPDVATANDAPGYSSAEAEAGLGYNAVK